MIEDPPLVAPFDTRNLNKDLPLTKTLIEISFHTIAGTTHPQTLHFIRKL